MSKINAVRIVNLNYNKNTMRVNDETFELGGESTLFCLRNGGGKTVLVQMIMAPFVNARYRDLKDRKFENYFNTQTPTYILVEWSLDNDSSYLLVGMGIKRKSASSDGDSGEDLDIFTFIHEYREGNIYDIHNFPVTEKTERGFKVKNFSVIKKVMDGLKVDRNYIFDYFDLAVDSQRRKYFESLSRYNINHREWESIIKRINLKESGLSDLFQDAKTVSGLVEKWFLPTVEDKLNDKDDKIKNFQEIMKKFVYQYRENESKIARRSRIEEFKSYSSNILESAKDYSMTKQKTESIKNDIANLYAYIESQITMLEAKKSDLESKLSRLYEELNEIEYERLSFEYYGICSEIEKLSEDGQGLQGIIDGLEGDIKNGMYEIALQECARLYDEYRDASRDVQRYENMLEVAKLEDREKGKERDNLGFTLKVLYRKIVDGQMEEMALKTKDKEEKEKKIGILTADGEKLNTRISLLTGDKSSLNARMETYNKEENAFSKKYGISLRRNIMGEYDKSLLDSYENAYNEKLERADREYSASLKEREAVKQELPQKRKELEDGRIKKIQLEEELKGADKDLDKMEGRIEEIKKILLYIGIDEDRIFDREYILRQLSRKIEALKADRGNLGRELEALEREKRMYETGRNIKLSKEIEERLSELNINIIFGLEWLKKQDISQTKKEELIGHNPFLPYSLIMSKNNLYNLKTEQAGVFTSFPLPIIERESLEENLKVVISNNVYTLGNINFLISFNNRLLNVEELKKLIESLSGRIDDIKGLIGIKDEEIDRYTDDRKKVEGFDITEASIINAKKRISEIQNDIADVKSGISLSYDRVYHLEEAMKKLDVVIRNLENEKYRLEDEKEDYSTLVDEYSKYLKCKCEYGQKCSELQKAKEDKDNNGILIKNETELLKTIEGQMTELTISISRNEDKAQKYLNFKDGEIIGRDIEDIEARFDTLSQGIGLQVKQLEELLNGFRKTFERCEKELIEKCEEYQIIESAYTKVSYDEVKMKSLKHSVRELEKSLKQKNAELGGLKIDIAKKEEARKYKLGEIASIGKEAPKDRLYISDLDFEGRRNIKNNEINGCRENIKGIEASLVDLNISKNKMNEYSGFKVSNTEELDYRIKDVDGIREGLRKSYIETIEAEREKSGVLSDMCQEISKNERFTADEFFKNTTDMLLEIRDNPEDVIKTLETVNQVHLKMLEQLECDLARVEEEKKNIIDMFYEYAQQVHEHLGRIDDNSSININGKYLKMLNIIQPDWEELGEQYRLKSKDFVENITKTCLDELSTGSSIEETMSTEITTRKLYDYIVGIGEIDVKLYKIEALRQVVISWNQVSENSGGEGFLSAFVILSSLLSYMRKEESDIFKTSEEGKVIIMDNPFAQTNAEHLLKPLMDIARKNNTQLICFTGLGGDSIYNRFDNIYVLNLVDSKLREGMQFIESEHTKGEDITHMTSSRFKIQMEKAKQMLLF